LAYFRLRVLGLIAGGFLGMIESLHAIPEYALQEESRSRQELANELIEVLLHGLRKPCQAE
jgi:hypothetical protein